jgi:hypothetical protein
VNGEDEPQEVALPLAALGIGEGAGGAKGGRYTAYDVWNDAPLADVQQVLRASIPPHTAFTVGLRPAQNQPQVIGTSRHVVQGAIDVGDEHWDAARRTLSARSTNLDARPCAVTIAVPRGLRPSVCTAEVPCKVTRLQSGHAVIEWAQSEGKDIAWSLSFRTTRRRQ